MMKIKAVIFDLDGTLIDSIPDIAGAANKMLENHGFPVHEMPSYIEWIGHGARQLIEKAIPEEQGDHVVEVCLKEFLSNYENNCTLKTKLYSGINTVLDYLTQQMIPFSILTNKPHHLTEIIVDHYFAARKFFSVQGQLPDYPKKPDPERALYIAGQLNDRPEEILFIGDSDTDIKTAVAAGMIPAGVTWGYGSVSAMSAAGCRHLFHKAEEIIEFVRNRD